MHLSLSVCLRVCLSACLSVSPLITPPSPHGFVCLSVYVFLCLSTCLSVCVSLSHYHRLTHVWKFPHYCFRLPAPSIRESDRPTPYCDVVLQSVRTSSSLYSLNSLFVFLEPQISPLPTNFTHPIHYSQDKKSFTPFPDCYLCLCLFLYLWSPNKRQNARARPFGFKWRMEPVM